MPEDQKGDVVAPATDKKETEEEDMDAPWMRFLIVFHQNFESVPPAIFRFCAEASGFLNPNVESSAKTLAFWPRDGGLGCWSYLALICFYNCFIITVVIRSRRVHRWRYQMSA